MTGWLQADSFAWERAQKPLAQHMHLHRQGTQTGSQPSLKRRSAMASPKADVLACRHAKLTLLAWNQVSRCSNSHTSGEPKALVWDQVTGLSHLHCLKGHPQGIATERPAGIAAAGSAPAHRLAGHAPAGSSLLLPAGLRHRAGRGSRVVCTQQSTGLHHCFACCAYGKAGGQQHLPPCDSYSQHEQAVAGSRLLAHHC